MEIGLSDVSLIRAPSLSFYIISVGLYAIIIRHMHGLRHDVKSEGAMACTGAWDYGVCGLCSRWSRVQVGFLYFPYKYMALGAVKSWTILALTLRRWGSSSRRRTSDVASTCCDLGGVAWPLLRAMCTFDPWWRRKSDTSRKVLRHTLHVGCTFILGHTNLAAVKLFITARTFHNSLRVLPRRLYSPTPLAFGCPQSSFVLRDLVKSHGGKSESESLKSKSSDSEIVKSKSIGCKSKSLGRKSKSTSRKFKSYSPQVSLSLLLFDFMILLVILVSSLIKISHLRNISLQFLNHVSKIFGT